MSKHLISYPFTKVSITDLPKKVFENLDMPSFTLIASDCELIEFINCNFTQLTLCTSNVGTIIFTQCSGSITNSRIDAKCIKITESTELPIELVKPQIVKLEKLILSRSILDIEIGDSSNIESVSIQARSTLRIKNSTLNCSKFTISRSSSIFFENFDNFFKGRHIKPQLAGLNFKSSKIEKDIHVSTFGSEYIILNNQEIPISKFEEYI